MFDFELPAPGSPEMVDLLCSLEHRTYEIANAWVLVVADEDTGLVAHSYGPFAEPEQALIEAGRQEAAWKAQDEDLFDWTYTIIPLWGPGE